MDIVIHFNAKRSGSPGRKLRAIAGPRVKAVLLLDAADRVAFAGNNKHNGNALTHVPDTFPKDDVTLIVDDTGAKTELKAGETGPPVCYWIEGELVCW